MKFFFDNNKINKTKINKNEDVRNLAAIKTLLHINNNDNNNNYIDKKIVNNINDNIEYFKTKTKENKLNNQALAFCFFE